MEALAVCSRLRLLAQSGARSGTVYAVFDHAVDLALNGQYALLGMIASDRTLTPYAVHIRAEQPFPQAGIRAGMAVEIAQGLLSIPACRVSVSLNACRVVDLSLDGVSFSGDRFNMAEALGAILSVLYESDELGLSALATGRGGNVYTDLLEPRMNELFDAMASGQAERVARCAMRVAGCGMGLTPSSDDLLCGYLVALGALHRAGRLRFDPSALLPVAAKSAAQRTNRISGTFLIQSGEGLASCDYLELIRSIFTGAERARVERDARRVASIGSTSGGDMLTGLALAINHHDGGKNSGSTGNQEKRVL